MNRLTQHILALVMVLMLVGIAISGMAAPKANCGLDPTWMKVSTGKDHMMRLNVLCWDGGGHIKAYRDNWPEVQVYCYGGKGYPGDD